MKKLLVALLIFVLVVPTAVASGPPPPSGSPPPPGPPPQELPPAEGGILSGPMELMDGPKFDEQAVPKELAGMEEVVAWKVWKTHELARSLTDEQRASIGQLLANNRPATAGKVGDLVQSNAEAPSETEGWQEAMASGMAMILTPEQYRVYQDALLDAPEAAIGPEDATDCYYGYYYAYYARYYGYYHYLYAFYAYMDQETPMARLVFDFAAWVYFWTARAYYYAYYADYYYYSSYYSYYAWYYDRVVRVSAYYSYRFAYEAYYYWGYSDTYYAYYYGYYTYSRGYTAEQYAYYCYTEG